jgi:hypothetical protein
MSRRKATHATQEVENGSVVVNRLCVRRKRASPLLDVVERVLNTIACAMTLATKLGTLVLLRSTRSSPFVEQQAFWRWCLESVTLLDGKSTMSKPIRKQRERPLKAKTFKEPEQKKKESNVAYQERCEAKRSEHMVSEQTRRDNHQQKRATIVGDKPYFRSLIQETWMNLAAHSSQPEERAKLSKQFTAQIHAYIVNVKNYVVTTLAKRVSKCVSHQVNELLDDCLGERARFARKNLHGALMSWILNKIQGKSLPEWKERRARLCRDFLKLQTWTDAKQIIEEHQRCLPQERFFDWQDAESISYLKTNSWRFFDYLKYLSEHSKKPFAILPQLKPRSRHIKCDRFTLKEMLDWAKKRGYNVDAFFSSPHVLPKKESKSKDAENDQGNETENEEDHEEDEELETQSKPKKKRVYGWEPHICQRVMLDLFKMPRASQMKRRCNFEGTFTTDGVKACWLFKRTGIPKASQKKTQKNKKRRIGNPAAATAVPYDSDQEDEEPKEVPVLCASKLMPGLYAHGEDFWLQREDPKKEGPKKNYVFVDPGHVNIMTGVYESGSARCFIDEDAQLFTLTNRWYRRHTGMRKRAEQSQARRLRDVTLQAAYVDLAANSSKTWDPGKFTSHVLAVLRHWEVLFESAFFPQERYDRFAAYQGKQRIINKIIKVLTYPAASTSPHQTKPRNVSADVAQLTSGKIDPSQTVLVVGSGVARATSRGHDSAPGKELRRRLAVRMPVIMTPEHYTSKMSCCCHALVKHGHYDPSTSPKKCQIRGLSHCTECNLALNRDASAALNIRLIFWHQAATKRKTNPLALKHQQLDPVT